MKRLTWSPQEGNVHFHLDVNAITYEDIIQDVNVEVTIWLRHLQSYWSPVHHGFTLPLLQHIHALYDRRWNCGSSVMLI